MRTVDKWPTVQWSAAVQGKLLGIFFWRELTNGPLVDTKRLTSQESTWAWCKSICLQIDFSPRGLRLFYCYSADSQTKTFEHLQHSLLAASPFVGRGELPDLRWEVKKESEKKKKSISFKGKLKAALQRVRQQENRVWNEEDPKTVGEERYSLEPDCTFVTVCFMKIYQLYHVRIPYGT